MNVRSTASFSSSSSDSSTAVPNSLPMGSPRRSTTITKVGTKAAFSSSSSDSSTAVPNSLPMGSPRRSTTITKVGTTATFSSSSSDSSTVVPKSLPMASVQPLSSNSARFHPKDFVSRVVPPTDYRQLELDVEDPNPSMPDGTTVRHYHTHNNNQTYNIYVTGGLAAAGLTKQAGQATDGSPDRSVLQKSPTHATLSSPNDGESFSKPNSHALQANPTSAFYSPPKRPGSVSFPLGRSDSATAVTASLDNNKESTTNISSDIILVGDSATVDTASLDNNKGNIKNIASDIVSADSTPSGVPTSTVHDDSTPSCVSTSKMNVSHARRRMSRTSRRKVATPEGDAEERELTEVEEREIQYNWFHEKYNKLMFNIDLDGNGLDGKPPIVPRCSQQLTNDSYEQLLEICFANQSGDEDRWRAVFRKYNTKIYDVIKNYHAKMLTNAEGEEVPRLYFGNRIAVPQRDVFPVIRDCHVSRSRHTKQNATSAIIRKMYCNITQKMVNT